MSDIHTVYLIHHSHADFGYTHDQPIVWDLHERFLDEAIELAEAGADSAGDGAFHWTIEGTGVLLNWLQHAPARQVERLKAMERIGRVEVTGMFANLTPLCDADQLVETLQPLQWLREEYGFEIRHAMNCDVNGHNWPLVDVLLDVGITGFSMAINTHFGGAPFQRPNAFLWQGPSGRVIPAWNGWSYDIGWRVGIGHDMEAFEQQWWPRVMHRLRAIGYPLPILMMQSYHPFGDNGSAFGGFSRFIDDWNARGTLPRLRMATPRMWWTALSEHTHRLPTYRGDWTDYWNFGCISSAREQAINRMSRQRLRTADLLAAAAVARADRSADRQLIRSFDRYRAPAWQALHLWDEHTWGANVSLRMPESEDTASQWHHKSGYAYTARSLSLLLQRDALAAFAQGIERESPDDLLVFNPLPWPRRLAGEIGPGVATPRGLALDTTAGRHFQDRLALDRLPLALDPAPRGNAEQRAILKPVDVPAFGYTVVPRAALAAPSADDAMGSDSIIDNERFRLTFDCERGGIRSWYDKRLGREWIDQQAEYRFNGFVHETVADPSVPWPRRQIYDMNWRTDQVEPPTGWNPAWPARRSQPTTVLSNQVYRTPLGYQVVQLLTAPGCVGPLRQSVLLPDSADYIECEAWWTMGQSTTPEATYIAYPFALPKPTARIDLGGQAITAGVDQLPGVCRDYFTVQGWVDFTGDDLGVTIATPENPMVQLGDFHFGHHQTTLELTRALLLGWVTNNYWETNFRAQQPGMVHCRYRILPYAGAFDEARAHRFGQEAAQAQPLVQHLGEQPLSSALYPKTGTLLQLPAAPILVTHIKPAARQPGMIIRLLNAGDKRQPAVIGSALLRIAAAWSCNLLEAPLHELDVRDGTVCLELAPRHIATVLLVANVAGADD